LHHEGPDFLNTTDPANSSIHTPVYSEPVNIQSPQPIATTGNWSNTPIQNDDYALVPMVLEQPDFLDTPSIPVVEENVVAKDPTTVDIVISTTQTADTTAAIQSMVSEKKIHFFFVMHCLFLEGTVESVEENS
jgi:hypothetical protein